jgi:parallel beta-helix repeat protein
MTNFKFKLLFLLFITLFSCKKKDSDSVLGLDVQPENDLLGVTITDSVSIFMHTQKVDSVTSYSDQYKYLGSNQDPIFGRTDASIYTNFSIADNLTNLSFGNNPTVDSAEIVLNFTGKSLGDSSLALTYDVYVLNENLVYGTTYYTSNKLSKSSTKIGSYTGKLKIRGTDVCMIIPIDKSFAQYIIQTNSNLTNNTAFQNAYKGFYITTSNSALGVPGSGGIMQYDLDATASGVNLYYHDGNSTISKGETAKFTFRGIDALRFNNIKHNYSSGATQNLFDQVTGAGTIDTLKGNSNIYLNTFGGTRVRVHIPYIKNFIATEKVSINRAELVIKIDETISPFSYIYQYPASLALIACSSAGAEELVYDQLETTDFVKYGGNYDATNKLYVFNIARQIQKILDGSIENYSFYLVNAQPNRSTVIRRDNRLERVVFGGKSNLSFKPYFKVTYVKYPYDK